MFADISGFTALAEQMDPEAARDLMNACFEELVPLIRRYGGTIDKFVGDAIVALFGAPIAHENDPERALRAALEMQEALAAFNSTRGTDLGLHFGINTGPVLAGGVGSSERRDYSVMGHAVNLAARLEDASHRGEILVGSDTFRRTAPLFEFEPLPPLAVKGASEPLRVFRLLGVRTVPGSLRGITGLRSPLVGRDPELAAIASLVEEVRRGRGGLLVVFGDPGVGKSRLLSEARDAANAGVDWFEGRALSHTQGMSFWTARDLFSAMLAISGTTPPGEAEEILTREMDGLFGGEARVIQPFVSRLLGIATGGEDEKLLADLTGEALLRRTLDAVARYVEARARRNPLLLVWEDLHWVDPSSLKVLNALVEVTRHAPLLLVGAFRREAGVAQEFHSRAREAAGVRLRELPLEPLSHAHSVQLLENLLETASLSKDARARILAKTEGNAFFLEEVLRALLDAGVVVLRGGRAVAVRTIETIDVPDTLHDVVASRLDRLPQADKRTLQTAAVIGRVFAHRLLRDVTSGADGGANGNGDEVGERAGDRSAGAVRDRGLSASLRELLEREFIRVRGAAADAAGEDTAAGRDPFAEPDADHAPAGAAPRARAYIFKHAVTQEVAYDGMLLTRRRALHRRVAEVLESQGRHTLDELSPSLGLHFARAQLAEKALDYLTRAADRARLAYANQEAIDFYRAALDQARHLLGIDAARAAPRRDAAANLQESLGDVLELVGGHEEARAAYTEALSLVEGEDRVRRSRLHRKTAKTWESQRRFDDALTAYAAAEETLGAPPLRAAALEALAGDGTCEPAVVEESAWWDAWIDSRLERIWVHYFRAELDEMAGQVDEMRPIVERRGTAEQRALLFLRTILLGFRRERYQVSQATLENGRQALAAAREGTNLPLAGHAQFALGLGHFGRGELDAAEQQLEEALVVAERTGDASLLARCCTYLSLVQRRRGDVRRTEELTGRMLGVAQAAQLLEYIAVARGNEAWLAWRAGAVDAAASRAREAFDFWRGGGWSAYPFKWTAAWPAIASALRRDGIDEAVDAARALLEPTQQPMPPELEAAVRMAVTAADGKRPAAEISDCLTRALELAATAGYV